MEREEVQGLSPRAPEHVRRPGRGERSSKEKPRGLGQGGKRKTRRIQGDGEQANTLSLQKTAMTAECGGQVINKQLIVRLEEGFFFWPN